MPTFVIIAIIGALIMLIHFVRWFVKNWDCPMNGFQDWLKLNHITYVKDMICVDDGFGGKEEIWHNNIWTKHGVYKMTTEEVYEEYLQKASRQKLFQRHFN